MISESNPLLLVGCGNMGRALANCWRSSLLEEEEMTIIAPTESKRVEITHALGSTCYDDITSLPSDYAPAAIVLAVKPNIVGSVLEVVKEQFDHIRPLVISVIAGKTLGYFSERLWPMARVARIMPNTPSTIGLGMSACCATEAISDEDKETLIDLMKSVGEYLWLDKESDIDAVTCVSGSGPAYVFYFLECFIEAGKKAGLDDKAATLLASQTLRGAAELAFQSDEGAAKLRQNVTSPNGTTQAGLQQLMNASGTLSELLEKTTQAAKARSIEISNDSQ
ncbi:MAG: pyrroline-5-carboxylate reductase [Rickettsiales bacterium]|nr:pyrroline-5-carboxylate reductase [Rickettsiales bacterium]